MTNHPINMRWLILFSLPVLLRILVNFSEWCSAHFMRLCGPRTELPMLRIEPSPLTWQASSLSTKPWLQVQSTHKSGAISCSCNCILNLGFTSTRDLKLTSHPCFSFVSLTPYNLLCPCFSLLSLDAFKNLDILTQDIWEIQIYFLSLSVVCQFKSFGTGLNGRDLECVDQWEVTTTI